jgi:hypothetical protein
VNVNKKKNAGDFISQVGVPTLYDSLTQPLKFVQWTPETSYKKPGSLNIPMRKVQAIDAVAKRQEKEKRRITENINHIKTKMEAHSEIKSLHFFKYHKNLALKCGLDKLPSILK